MVDKFQLDPHSKMEPNIRNVHLLGRVGVGGRVGCDMDSLERKGDGRQLLNQMGTDTLW